MSDHEVLTINNERFLLPLVAVDKPLDKLFTVGRLCSHGWIILTTSMCFLTWMREQPGGSLCCPHPGVFVVPGAACSAK